MSHEKSHPVYPAGIIGNRSGEGSAILATQHIREDRKIEMKKWYNEFVEVALRGFMLE